MENLNAVNDAQTPVVEASTETEAVARESAAEQAQSAGVADPPAEQSAEDNTRFAELRRKYEKQLRDKDDLARQAGFDSVEAMVEAHRAEEAGMSVDEFRRQQISDEARRKETVEQSPEYLQMKEELTRLQGERLTQRMQDDLRQIREVYPDVKTLEDLGNVFTNLVAAGTDPVTAARAAMAVRATPPAPIGQVGTSSRPSGDEITDEDIAYYEDHPGEMRKLGNKKFTKLIEQLSKRKE